VVKEWLVQRLALEEKEAAVFKMYNISGRVIDLLRTAEATTAASFMRSSHPFESMSATSQLAFQTAIDAWKRRPADISLIHSFWNAPDGNSI
jgi:hypothetical protein